MANRYLPEVLSKRACRWLRQTDWRLNAVPTIEDDILREKAKNMVDRWDVDTMREYLLEDDLKLLLANRDANSME